MVHNHDGELKGAAGRDAERSRRDFLFWLTLMLTSFAIAPFSLPGYFWGANDARHHVYFLFEFDRVFQDGVWWPRWSPDFAFGYGYPFFNIYAPFSHFVAQLMLRGLRFDYTTSIEIVFALSIVGSAASMYLYVRSWMGRQPAMVSALVYVYAPYHLLDLYVRANLAESMAFVWMPLCLWTARKLFSEPAYRWVAGLSVSLAGLLLTSQLVTLLFAPLFGFYMLTLWFHSSATAESGGPFKLGWRQMGPWARSAALPALSIVGALGLSAIFWIPMVWERNDVRVDQWFEGRYSFESNFVYFFQLLSPRWGFDVSIPGPNDNFSFQLGVVPVVLTTLGLLAIWKQFRLLDQQIRWELLSFCAIGIGTTIVSLQIAAPLWDVPLIGGLLSVAQFPWRWLTITTLCLSVLSGVVLHPVLRPHRGIVPSSLVTFPQFTAIAVIILGSYPLLRVNIIEPAEGPVSLAGLMRFQRSADEMTGSTRWVKEIPTWSPMAEYYERQAQANPNGSIEPVDSKVDYSILDYAPETGFVIDSKFHNTIMEEVWYFAGTEDRRIVYEHFYYPGWRAYLLSGEHGEPVEELEIIPEAEGTLGRMTVPVPKGEGYVLLRFEDTQPRVIGQIVSLVAVVLMSAGGAFVALWKRNFL